MKTIQTNCNIENKNEIYYRQKETTQIEYYINGLKADINQNILLTGCEGIGKTSLLEKIIKEIDKNYIITYINLEEYENLFIDNLEEYITLNILQKIIKTIKSNKNISIELKNKLDIFENNENDQLHQISTITDISIDSNLPFYENLRKQTFNLPQKIIDKEEKIHGHIIILDNLEKIPPENIKEIILETQNKNPNISYIYSCNLNQNLEKLIKKDPSIIHIPLKRFNKEQTIQYTNAISNITFSNEAANKFYDYTQGIPLYINTFINVLENNNKYTEDEIKTVYKYNMDQIYTKTIINYSKLDKHEKEIIKIIMKEEKTTWTKLNNKLPFNKGTFIKYLEQLINKSIIIKLDKEYKINDRILVKILNQRIK